MCHPLHRRNSEVHRNTVRQRHKSDFHYDFHRRGTMLQAIETYGGMGTLRGYLEGLSECAVEGEVIVSIKQGYATLQGELRVYNPPMEGAVIHLLHQVERVARALAHSGDLQNYEGKYSQALVTIETS
jgi:hypothetical protein